MGMKEVKLGYKYRKSMLGNPDCCMDVIIGANSTFGLLIESWGVPFRFWGVLIDDPNGYSCSSHVFSTFNEAKHFAKTAKVNGWDVDNFLYQKID